MLKIFTAALLLFIFLPLANGQKNCSPYLDQDGLECVMTWNTAEGSSQLFFYDAGSQTFAEAPYQLSPQPTGDGGLYQFSPYLDQDGLECVLAWNESTGFSKLFFYSTETKSFSESPYQLPANPTGDAGQFHFAPYLDQDGVECILVSNITTGTSKLYFYDTDDKEFALSPYQLPTRPTGDEGTYYCLPYLDQDGVECVLTYNSKTGSSVLYFYDSGSQSFAPSPYQLAVKPTADEGTYHFRPYLDQDGAECVIAWNSKTGKSVLFFYDSSTKTFKESPYQLPGNPTGDNGTIGIEPYLDQDGVECMLTWNADTGTSRLYFYDAGSKSFQPAPYQLEVLK